MAMSEYAGIGSHKLFGRSAMTTDRPKAPTKFYTIEQIAERLEASARSVRRWIKEGLLIVHRINGEDFQAFLAADRDH
jgi:excisionase family DNA binding protein